MNVKSYSKTICIFLALIIFSNQILVSANSLFLNGSTLFSSFLNKSLTDDANAISCHDESLNEPLFISAVSTTDLHSSEENKIESHDDTNKCCVDICLCNDTGCHTLSLLSSVSSQSVFSSNQPTNFNLPIYLSLTSLPNSPPPII